ncbi:MAG: hypothetical protein ABIN37_01965 [Burkholderiaceae bacterium]
MRTIIGIVGYYGFVRGYPLGPELMERLTALPWPDGVEIREMNWGPVAIVQDFQASADKPDRLVLVGALDRGLAMGSVSCRRWVGGALETAAVQRRMFEAVTGVISLDNLLVIGGHFGVWPSQTYTVELQWAESGLGDLVLGEIELIRGSGQILGEQPLTPENDRIVQRLVACIRDLALDNPPPDVQPLGVEQLTPVAPVLHHRFFDDLGMPP